MTADVELLPLYAELQGHPKLEIIKHYARANVARATAAKDAEIEALREEVNRFRALEAEAAEFVEVPIINRTKFTGDEPYVGWRGLGRALNEALDERDALRAEVERSERYAEQSERERLWAEERAERLAEALREVMLWIENWSPPFTEDDEWPDTEAKAQAALHPAAAQESNDA